MIYFTFSIVNPGINVLVHILVVTRSGHFCSSAMELVITQTINHSSVIFLQYYVYRALNIPITSQQCCDPYVGIRDISSAIGYILTLTEISYMDHS